MSNKPPFVCTKCGADHFKTRGGLSCHYTRVHPYIPPPPPVRTHVNFKDLVGSNNWGIQMTEAQKKSPSDQHLMFAYLARIIELQEAILTELRKPRTIN
jgi:hypothetical protein